MNYYKIQNNFIHSNHFQILINILVSNICSLEFPCFCYSSFSSNGAESIDLAVLFNIFLLFPLFLLVVFFHIFHLVIFAYLNNFILILNIFSLFFYFIFLLLFLEFYNKLIRHNLTNLHPQFQEFILKQVTHNSNIQNSIECS